MNEFINKTPELFLDYKVITEWDLPNYPVSKGWHVLQVIKVTRGTYITDGRYENSNYTNVTVYTGQIEDVKLLVGQTEAGKTLYG